MASRWPLMRLRCPLKSMEPHIPALIGIQDASQIQAGRSLEGVLDKGLQPVGLVRDLTQLRHKTAVFPLQCVQRGGETVSGVGQAVLQSAGQIFQPLRRAVSWLPTSSRSALARRVRRSTSSSRPLMAPLMVWTAS